MDAAVAGALAGGGVSAVGALGAQAIAAWRANKQDVNALARDEAQANRTRLDYLREVLEAAALALHNAGMLLDNTGNVIAWVQQRRLKVTDADTGEELAPREALVDPLIDFQESMGELWRQESRLALLIPPDHEAYVGLRDAADAYHRALVAFEQWQKGEGEMTGQELSAALRQTQEEVTPAEMQFRQGSRSAIGPKLA
jgi:hypothetical protein